MTKQISKKEIANSVPRHIAMCNRHGSVGNWTTDINEAKEDRRKHELEPEHELCIVTIKTEQSS